MPETLLDKFSYTNVQWGRSATELYLMLHLQNIAIWPESCWVDDYNYKVFPMGNWLKTRLCLAASNSLFGWGWGWDWVEVEVGLGLGLGLGWVGVGVGSAVGG